MFFLIGFILFFIFIGLALRSLFVIVFLPVSHPTRIAAIRKLRERSRNL